MQSLSFARPAKMTPYAQIGFRLKESGMMKKFEGTWQIQPFNQATLDQNFGYNTRQGQNWMAGPVNAFQGIQKSEHPFVDVR